MVTEQLKRALTARLTPQVKSISFSDGECVLKPGLPVHVASAHALTPEEQEKLRKSLRKFKNFEPDLIFELDNTADPYREEQYSVTVAPDMIRIVTREYAGAAYALKSLHQLAEPERGGLTYQYEVLQPCQLDDEPATGFRGIHLCIFPETPMRWVLKELRLAAAHKYNYAVIEPWGVFPYKSHPEFVWQERAKTMAEFEELKAAAKECDIKLFPQLNILGHAAMSRGGSAKHVVMDFHPELESIYEPGGWTYCLTNKNAIQIIQDLAMELYEFFDRPEYFHIGCDEAFDIQTCRECAKVDPLDLLGNHISYFHDLFAKMGTRLVMWHDMLIQEGDPRFKGCTACGDKRFVDLLPRLPKDLIIAVWEYDAPPEGSEIWKTLTYFKDQGFDVLISPWYNQKGMAAAGKVVREMNVFGMLETTWCLNYGNFLSSLFIHSADAAWGAESDAASDLLRTKSMMRTLRDIDTEIGGKDYKNVGFSTLQVSEEPFPS